VLGTGTISISEEDMDKEIKFFTDSIRAFEPAPADDNYILFRRQA
jgi:hypothetical protein